MTEESAGNASSDRTVILWQWRGAALVLIGIASVFFALDSNEPWLGPFYEPVEFMAFVLVLGAPAVAVTSLVSGMMPTRIVVRVVLDLVAAAWAAWMAGLLVDLSYIHPEGALPRSAWFAAASITATMLVVAWRLEDALARRRLGRRWR